MKKIIQNITKRNIWLVNFTSCLAGTILGIILTFGISTYIQEQQSRELSLKTIKFSLSNIERNLESIEYEVEKSAYLDSLFQSLYKHYPLGASEVDKDTLFMFFEAFFSLDFDIIDNSAQSIFSTNIETWKNSDNLELLEDIGDCFSIIEQFNYQRSRINTIKEDFTSEYLNSVSINELIKNPDNLAETFFSAPGFQNCAIQHNSYIAFINTMHEILSESIYITDSTFCVELGLDPLENTYWDYEY